MMTIEHLNDDCLLDILNKLPLSDALAKRVVNRRWNRLVLKMCLGRKNLLLFGSFRSLADYAKHLIRFGQYPGWDMVPASQLCQFSLIVTWDRLSASVVKELLALFPNIQKLVLFYYHWPNVMTLQKLFAHYQEHLISLTVHGMPNQIGQQKYVWQAINEMPKLTRLHLFATNRLVIPAVNHIQPLFARLEHLTLVNYCNGNAAVLLGQLGQRFKTLILDNVELSKELLESVIQHAPHLSKSLKNLFIGNIFYPKYGLIEQPVRIQIDNIVVFDFPQVHHHQLTLADRRAENPKKVLDYICHVFSQLKHVDVAFMPWTSARELNFGQIIEQLAQLEQLQSVHLTMTASEIVDNERLLSLPSVKVLQLDLNPPAADYFKHILPFVFVSAKHIQIECIDACTLKNVAQWLSSSELKLSKIQLNQTPNLKQFFSDLGFGEKYTAYLFENFGQLAQLF